MSYMEIAILPKTSLRLKGKNASFVVNPEDNSGYNATILLGKIHKAAKVAEDDVVIDGAGEYEIGGVKITGVRSGSEVLYSLKIDEVEIALGTLAAFDVLHSKMKEYDVFVVLCDEVRNVSFLTSLDSRVMIFYGEKAQEIAKASGKDGVKEMPKYAVTKDKLPQEVETIVLA